MAVSLIFPHNSFTRSLSLHIINTPIPLSVTLSHGISTIQRGSRRRREAYFERVYGARTSVECSASANPNNSSNSKTLKTCKNCKTQFDPALNHPRACRFHTAHFGGETKRKFESVYTGGTMDTPDSGKVFQYWHCCGSEDPFDPGCTAAHHASYDD